MAKRKVIHHVLAGIPVRISAFAAPPGSIWVYLVRL